ncbi:anthrone oxygenase family protein [Actinophytocola sediminis]
MTGIVHGTATVTVGLIAGTFFDWSVSIMPALAESDDRTYVTVMQETIRAMNKGPLFVGTFIGAFVFTGAAALLQRRIGARAAVRWILAGLLLYLAAMLITFGVHFPLNDTLDKAGDPDKIADLAALREETEQSWVTAHTARTIAVTLATACLCRSLWVRRG